KTQNRVLAVVVPAAAQEAGFRLPAVRQQQRISVQHPSEINALVDLCRQGNDLRVVGELRSHRQNAREQERSVYRRNLALPSTLAGIKVHPVIEPPVYILRAVQEEAERHSQPPPRLVAKNPMSIRGDAQRSETKSGGADARDVVTRVPVSDSRAVCVRAVQH